MSTKLWYIHKHQVWLEYGGSEEGGWWYDCGKQTPVSDWNPAEHPYRSEDEAYQSCRALNDYERVRRANQEDYDYHSVLAHQSTHYSYSVEDFSEPFNYPESKPHYE